MAQGQRRARRHGEMELLLRAIDQGFDHQAWHGPTLAGALRGVTWRQALWRPHPARHNVWELALHTAYWKYAVRRRLTDGTHGGFPRAGSNWPGLPEAPAERAWRAGLGGGSRPAEGRAWEAGGSGGGLPGGDARNAGRSGPVDQRGDDPRGSD